ncbi:hypothetical protein ACFVX9_01435 [Kitasatospora sp. NPDC058243]|uniref:hypothetical protein n=1 Tax=Kitasatospora sp. NPDC058243 TaxID=3346397 RepID=UPI0036DAE935
MDQTVQQLPARAVRSESVEHRAAVLPQRLDPAFVAVEDGRIPQRGPQLPAGARIGAGPGPQVQQVLPVRGGGDCECVGQQEGASAVGQILELLRRAGSSVVAELSQDAEEFAEGPRQCTGNVLGEKRN